MIIFDNPATVPAPAGQYSHLARVEIGGKTILQLSGQVAIDADGEIVGDDMTTQANFIMDNVAAMLAAHGAGLADVVNIRTYITDMSQLSDFGKVRAARFAATPPTITTVEVPRLWVRGALLEVEVLAIVGSAGSRSAIGRLIRAARSVVADANSARVRRALERGARDAE